MDRDEKKKLRQKQLDDFKSKLGAEFGVVGCTISDTKARKVIAAAETYLYLQGKIKTPPDLTGS